MKIRKIITLSKEEVLEAVSDWYNKKYEHSLVEYAEESFSLSGDTGNKTFTKGEFVVGGLKFYVKN